MDHDLLFSQLGEKKKDCLFDDVVTGIRSDKRDAEKYALLTSRGQALDQNSIILRHSQHEHIGQDEEKDKR